MRVHPDIVMFSKTVPVQSTMTVYCPYCKDDWDNQNRPLTWHPERSMSISRIDVGVLYKCHRASCSKSGFLPLEFKIQEEKKEFVPRLYPYPLHEPPMKAFRYLKDRFELTEDDTREHNIRYCLERDSVVYTITDEFRHEVGVVDRDYFHGRKPKSVAYWFNDVPKVCVIDYSGGPIYITEDIVSAIKLFNIGYSSAALLGTHMTEEVARKLRTLADSLVLCLDADAVQKAVQIRDKYKFYFSNIEIKYLQKDIKDTSYEELRRLL